MLCAVFVRPTVAGWKQPTMKITEMVSYLYLSLQFKFVIF